MKIYAGIGSRQTPPDVLGQMIKIAQYLGREGWLLRSGGAEGADKAFEQGCDDVHGRKEILLPWKGFSGNQSTLWLPSSGRIRVEAIDIASKVHSAWLNVHAAGKALHARNVLQVLGPKLDEPVDLVICWTVQGRVEGGTATAILIAKSRGITVFNFGEEFHRREFWELTGLILSQSFQIQS